MGFLYLFSIKNVFYDKMDLRLCFHVMKTFAECFGLAPGT